jgi:hypothetical protein
MAGGAGPRLAEGRGAVFPTSDAGATKERLSSGPQRASKHSPERAN